MNASTKAPKYRYDLQHTMRDGVPLQPSFRRSSFARDLAVIVAVLGLLLSKWAGAATTATQTNDRTGKTVPCKIVYINGDAVITCPKGR